MARGYDNEVRSRDMGESRGWKGECLGGGGGRLGQTEMRGVGQVIEVIYAVEVKENRVKVKELKGKVRVSG